MTVTRLSAISATKPLVDLEGYAVNNANFADGFTIVGGAGALTDETDLTTYADWNVQNSGSTSCVVLLQVDFGTIPNLQPGQSLILHLFAGAPTPTNGRGAILSPFGINATNGQLQGPDAPFTLLTSSSSEVGHYTGLVRYCGNGNVPAALTLNAGLCQFAAGTYSYFFNQRIYGAYLQIVDGTQTSPPMAGTPFVACNMYNGGLLVLDSTGTVIDDGGGSVQNLEPLALWTDGQVGFTDTANDFGTPFRYLTGDRSAMGSAVLTAADEAFLYTTTSGCATMVTYPSKGTVLVQSNYDSYVTKSLYIWEIDKLGNVLRTLVEKPGTNTNFYWSSGVAHDEKVIYQAGNSSDSQRTSQYSSTLGVAEIHQFDLSTLQETTLISDLHMLPNGGPYPNSMCVDPADGTIYALHYGYMDPNQFYDAGMGISRFSSTGVFLGRVWFNSVYTAATGGWFVFSYNGLGGITVAPDGRLVWFYSGNTPNTTNNEYDGLLQLPTSSIPVDGSTVGVSIIPFWEARPGLQEGIAGDVTSAMTYVAPFPGGLGARRVQFS